MNTTQPQIEKKMELESAEPKRGRRVWLIGLCAFFALGAAIGYARSVIKDGGEIDYSLPKPSLSPDDVVRLQLQSLREGHKDIDALKVCYSFASPSNRELSGSLANFAELVSTAAYAPLGTYQESQVGNAAIVGDEAAVFVSLLSEDGDVAAYRFYLIKQTADPYQDCWMTEGVFPIPLESIDLNGVLSEAIDT